jgi:hypothetical protein
VGELIKVLLLFSFPLDVVSGAGIKKRASTDLSLMGIVVSQDRSH